MDMDRIERIRGALEWVISQLEEAGVPFQVAGGLAALAHGASRPLNDIDIYVPEGALERLRSELADHHSHGPHRYRDQQWDCYFMEVGYEGEEIELAEAPRTRYRKGPRDAWHQADIDFNNPVIREVFGVEIPVMPVDQLVAYKQKIGRPVDREDLDELNV